MPPKWPRLSSLEEGLSVFALQISQGSAKRLKVFSGSWVRPCIVSPLLIGKSNIQARHTRTTVNLNRGQRQMKWQCSRSTLQRSSLFFTGCTRPHPDLTEHDPKTWLPSYALPKLKNAIELFTMARLGNGGAHIFLFWPKIIH
jgi:hypothetical protein